MWYRTATLPALVDLPSRNLALSPPLTALVYDWDRFHLPGAQADERYIKFNFSNRSLHRLLQKLTELLRLRGCHAPTAGNSDTLIGETTIDLEDRWFHKKWQGIKSEKSSDGSGFLLEPLEMRL